MSEFTPGKGDFSKGDRVSYQTSNGIQRTGTVEHQNYLHTFIKPDSSHGSYPTEMIHHGRSVVEQKLRKL